MDENQSSILQENWNKGRVPGIDGFVFGDGKVILIERSGGKTESPCPEELNRKTSHLKTLLDAGITWDTVQECARLEMEEENLRLTSGKAGANGAGYISAEEINPRRLIWAARFSFSRPFFTVKFGDDALIADSQDYLEWKFPLGNPEALTIGPSEERPPAPPSQSELVFKDRYPILYHFLETTLWPDVDGYNPIELLHQIAYHGTPDTTKKLIRELRTLYADEEIGGEVISDLFNKEDIGHPYQVVNAKNAKDFCFSMQESLRFIATLKK